MATVNDMIEIGEISDAAIAANLRGRLKKEIIYVSNNGYKTEWSLIWSVIIRVNDKFCLARVCLNRPIGRNEVITITMGPF